MDSRDASASATRTLMPVVARAVDLGRGPPALMRWVAHGLEHGHDMHELASRLARVLLAGAGNSRQAQAADTFDDREHQMGGSTCP